jgi:hypothetical protein
VNYAALVAAVQDYTENTFSTVDMNLFITQAETRIYNTIEFPNVSKTATITFVANDPYLACPTDFIAAQSFAVIVSGVYTFLQNKDPNFMREAYSAPTATGTPKYYAIYGPTVADNKLLRFIVGPTPASALSGELQYFYYPESITTVVGGQTWLGDNFSPILLYGTLVEAYTQMKGDADMITLYDSKYKEAIALAKKLGDGRMKTDDYRSGGGRIQG